MTRDFGCVEVDGKTLRLNQDAFAENFGTAGAVRYYAQAVDEIGNKYRITWETTPEWDARAPEDREDESEACDWDHPVDVVLTDPVDALD